MGSLEYDEVPSKSLSKNGSKEYHSAPDKAFCSWTSFEIPNVASPADINLSGMHEDLILLSWCLVLQRIKDGEAIDIAWGHNTAADHPRGFTDWKILTSDKIPNWREGLETVSEFRSAISKCIAADQHSHLEVDSSRISLVLGTSGATGMSEDAENEGALHIELIFRQGRLHIRPAWYDKNMLPFTSMMYVDALIEMIKRSSIAPSKRIIDCMGLMNGDLECIWGWNHVLPSTYDICMHEVVSEQARRFPGKVAISSWDGDLTYSQIEHYSTYVAWLLKNLGTKPHDLLPICFEKSCWTIVAVIAVMKAGATFVLMDPSLPIARLQNMAEQVSAKMIVTSRSQSDLSEEILPRGIKFVIEGNTFTNDIIVRSAPKLPPVSTSTLMYIIFTSGSTGAPKGVTISHRTYSSSAIPRAQAVGYTESSRVLDFASYAFDVSIDSMICTLSQGGCLCIPSDQDRMNDINGVIKRMKVNYAGITPSVARILEPDVIASLAGLGLGGEAATTHDVMRWGKVTRIIIGYGPCECTIGCTINSSAATGRNYVSIGKGNGAAIWVVDPDDHESLMPVGAVGELLVEGPIVGQGYLNDPKRTAAAFIDDPKWLTNGHGRYAGRSGRLYKTGDLGKYDPDGSGGIVFVGRKDNQVKLRGQRVELGEIEFQMKSRLPLDANVIAEVIVSQESAGQPILVAFISDKSLVNGRDVDLVLSDSRHELRKALSGMSTELSTILPRYMIPTAYISVNFIPVLISGKTDRRTLRNFGATINLRHLDLDTPQATLELSELGVSLRDAWGHVLEIDAEKIQPVDNYFGLGGDSLMAMRLVAYCTSRRLLLTVSDVFQHPTLAAMATKVSVHTRKPMSEISPFSMISTNGETACFQASLICSCLPLDIEDIYPCSPTQESLFTFSIKASKAYIAQRVAEIPDSVSTDRWKRAWDEAVAGVPMLRTRLVQLQEPGLFQAVLKETVSWKHSTDLELYLEEDKWEKMDLGKPLARYAIIDDSQNGKRYMVWTVHHVLYDGWSEPLTMELVEDLLQSVAIKIHPQMKDFISHIRSLDFGKIQNFWQRELHGATGQQFPSLPKRDYLPVPDGLLEREITLDPRRASGFTMATLIRAAWALVASQYTGNDDVVIGETLTGRDIALVGVEGIQGPLIATVPVRIQIDRTASVKSYLQAIQQGMLSRAPYQHFGMQNIRRVSNDAQYACEAHTGLVIQPERSQSGGRLGFQEGDSALEALHFNPYPLMLAAAIRKSGFRICASYDKSLIGSAQMGRMLAQLQEACSQLTKDVARKVAEVSCLPAEELNAIWARNQIPPLAKTSPGNARAGSKLKHGARYPQLAISWVCDPKNPDLLMPAGCIGELWLESNFLSGQNFETPAWLVAGSSEYAGRSGLVHPTGDLVQMQEDDTLVFIGHKDVIMPSHGKAIHVAQLDAHIARCLPPGFSTATAVVETSANHTMERKSRLLVFVRNPYHTKEEICLLPQEHGFQCQSSEIVATISANIDVTLASILKELHKSIQESLAPSLLPAGYVPIATISHDLEDLDQATINDLGSAIPHALSAQLWEGITQAWSALSMSLTASERIVRSAWAKVLGVKVENIGVDDNFFRMGGDSVMAMRMVSKLLSEGHVLTVADIFQNMRLRDAATVLRIDAAPTGSLPTYKPFSLLDELDAAAFPDLIHQNFVDRSWSIQDILPATDSQVLDIKATVKAPRTSMQYIMLYLDAKLDYQRLIVACETLVQSHDILRTVFVEHESKFFQVVVEKLEGLVHQYHTEKNLQEFVPAMCKASVELDYRLGKPFLSIDLISSINGEACLLLGLSHAQYDGISLPNLLRDLELLYQGKDIDIEPFASYVSQTRDKHLQLKALEYWDSLLRGSRMSILGGRTGFSTQDQATILTKAVNLLARPSEITISSLVTSAWALTLSRHTQQSDVTFGSVTSGRSIDMINVQKVMGPCYQFTPVRVAFQSQWTSGDLLHSVQSQVARSAAFDFLGFELISARCTSWPGALFYDSLVHHQDFEDFDTMPFDDSTCKVETLNPHGDAAYPLKVISSVKGGQLHVGIVGSERDTVFLQMILEELGAAVEQLLDFQSCTAPLDFHRENGQTAAVVGGVGGL